MPPTLDITLGSDHDVLAHRVQQLTAERASVRRRPVALRAPHRPPAGLFHLLRD
jgi:hypothetical protein